MRLYRAQTSSSVANNSTVPDAFCCSSPYSLYDPCSTVYGSLSLSALFVCVVNCEVLMEIQYITSSKYVSAEDGTSKGLKLLAPRVYISIILIVHHRSLITPWDLI